MCGAWYKACQWRLDDLTRGANIHGTGTRSLDLSASPERLCRTEVDVSPTGLLLSTELSPQWVSRNTIYAVTADRDGGGQDLYLRRRCPQRPVLRLHTRLSNLHRESILMLLHSPAQSLPSL